MVGASEVIGERPVDDYLDALLFDAGVRVRQDQPVGLLLVVGLVLQREHHALLAVVKAARGALELDRLDIRYRDSAIEDTDPQRHRLQTVAHRLHLDQVEAAVSAGDAMVGAKHLHRHRPDLGVLADLPRTWRTVTTGTTISCGMAPP